MSSRVGIHTSLQKDGMPNVLDMLSGVRDRVLLHASLHIDHLHAADERTRQQLGGTHRNTGNISKDQIPRLIISETSEVRSILLTELKSSMPDSKLSPKMNVDSLVYSNNEIEEEIEKEEDDLEYFDTFPTREEFEYHKWLLKNPCSFSVSAKRSKGLCGNFTYECDFEVFEDTSSVIDHYLRGMVLGKPFVKESRLVYDKNE
ncbi:hypothetical protein Tco_1057794 [Tanacetum coccineum]|uniref:Uncharacterized protein n=1 Tax=Tanacetum coccineum TaxID=301880 RepID=A0ABQ5H860_9ASTR